MRTLLRTQRELTLIRRGEEGKENLYPSLGAGIGIRSNIKYRKEAEEIPVDSAFLVLRVHQNITECSPPCPTPILNKL